MSTKSITIRLPEEQYKYLSERAEKEHRNMSNMIISIIYDVMGNEIGEWKENEDGSVQMRYR